MTNFAISPSDEPITLLTTDIMGAEGFRIDWHYQSHWCDVKCYRIYKSELQPGTPLFHRKDSPIDSFVLNTQEAEVYLEGNLRADGCSDLNQGAYNWCGEQEIIHHCLLLRYLWQKAQELMAVKPDA